MTPELEQAFRDWSAAFEETRALWRKTAPSHAIIAAFEKQARLQFTVLELLDAQRRKERAEAYQASVPKGGG